MATRVFISYRRDDSGAVAGRISDRLRRLIGKANVFFDISAIDAGHDFEQAIKEALSSCDAAAIFIGEQWLAASPTTGQPRIEDDKDVVRAEIRAALARDILIVPVLVGAAVMPGEAQLPADIAALTRRNALRLRHERFDDDAAALLKALTGRSDRGPALLRRLLFGLSGAAAGLAAEVAAALALNGLTGRALAEYIGVDLTLLSFVAAALVGALVGLRIERR